ncbi:TetR/AcrR family transcriptional regulator [Aestuariimicrobium sp. p3-SID1156]|uniref:TetR/AcrR family transcriptional regulator n=1 Tax=Aestuariimicrobium sp. p3-SID1156 TaxID=2916038 RepID=UPI00223B7835|nr:TetR/AcrR family transcriptional regulator [Aestuariimicrobium sp. p3-SID1156]MCT1459638.1 TetR/AcrR family transcriptional regulator [Aestuariimicrobium sp. p3-SID1156]
MAGIREQNRFETRARILASARRQIAEKGAGSLSTREVARDVGMVSSAVFRYFDSRDALLTALILESYGNLADALQSAARDSRGAGAWRDLAHCLREWATERPHEFQLLYGTPVPGYQAPRETIPEAARVAEPFLRAAAEGGAPELSSDVAAAMEPLVADLPDAPVAGLTAAIAALAQLVGVLTLELSGHFVGVMTSAEPFYEHVVEQQVRSLGFVGPV